jgi:very-short-patch-repair endonuclease
VHVLYEWSATLRIEAGAWRVMQGADFVIARLAGKNNRVVTWSQLVAAGVGRGSIDHRLAIGRLFRVHRGVYLLDPPHDASRLTLFTAAVAACGKGACLSHRSAAELWGVLPGKSGPVDVTVVGRNPGERDGIRRHRSVAVRRRDVRVRQGIRVTAPARTILDLATCIAPGDLERVVAGAERDGLARDRELRAALARCPTHPGAARLEAVLTRAGGPALTRSEAEARLLALIRDAHLPAPATNIPLNGFEVDFLWPNRRLVAEVDGFAFHGDRRAFERDRARDAALVAAGHRVIRVTWRQLDQEPLSVVATLAGALAVGPATD